MDNIYNLSISIIDVYNVFQFNWFNYRVPICQMYCLSLLYIIYSTYRVILKRWVLNDNNINIYYIVSYQLLDETLYLYCIYTSDLLVFKILEFPCACYYMLRLSSTCNKSGTIDDFCWIYYESYLFIIILTQNCMWNVNHMIRNYLQ